MMGDFFLTLPSNVQSYNRINTVANYKTVFDQPIILNGQYEVALKEIHYSNSFYNIPETPLYFIYESPVKLVKDPNGKFNFKTELLPNESTPNFRYIQRAKDETYGTLLTLPGRKYKTSESVLTELNKLYEKMGGGTRKIRFKIKEKNLIVRRAHMEDRQIWPFFSRELQDLLGFDGILSMIESGDLGFTNFPLLEAPKPFRINDGRQHIYCYCSCIKPNMVGNKSHQLLRIIEVPDINFNEMAVFRFNSPYYFDVVNNEITNIEIDFKFDDGKSVPFEGGRSICILHFRQKSL